MSASSTITAAVRATFRSLTRGERIAYVVILVARAVVGLLDVAGIAVIGVIASLAAIRLDPSAEPVRLFGLSLPQVDNQGLVVLVVIVLALFVAKALIAVLLVRGQAYFVARIETRVANRMIDYLLDGSLLDATRASKAEVQFTLNGSVTYAYTGLLNNVATLVAESFLLLVIVAALLAVNPVVSIFTLVYFTLVVVLIQSVIGRHVKLAAERVVEGTIATTNALSDILDAFREVAVLGKQRVFAESVAAPRERIAHNNATMTYLAGMPRYVVETALILGVVILVAQQFLMGGLAAGIVTVGVFLAGGVRMMSSLLPLQTALANIRNNTVQARPALALLERIDALPPAPTFEPVDDVPTRGLEVRVDNVSFRYPGSRVAAIEGMTFSVAGGRNIALIGPSGAGKTTLVDLILGLVPPDSGAITIGGAPAAALRLSHPGQIGYVPQRPGIVSGSIAENIALGVAPNEIDLVALDAAIDAAYLRDFVDGLPDGVNTSVGKQADALSGGQIQRIGIARALYTGPRLIVLDEATSGLDASSEDFVSMRLRELHGEVTVVIIAHRLSTVQHADEVFVVDGGRIIASGDFATVRREVPMVAEYVKLMSFAAEDSAAAAAAEDSA